MNDQTMRRRARVILRTAAIAAATLAGSVAGAAPSSAAQPLPFKATIGGTIAITQFGDFGPTAAEYSGKGVATLLGATSLQGDIAVTGPAPCQGGFSATHSDTLTAANGDRVSVTIAETSCPRPGAPGTFDCTGTYTVAGGTGRFATASGSGGWSGTVNFSPSWTGTFTTTHTGTLAL